MAQYAWLKADEKPRVAGVQFTDDEYGKEFDIYATYKVYNNLSYTVGFGYFWTGDYFKGDTSTLAGSVNSVTNDYLIVNKLTFTF